MWHSSLTKKLTNQLESKPVRALRIIFGDKSYEEALDFTGLQTLEDRWESIAWKMFMSILHPENCLNKLLPDRKNQDSISRLRMARSYPFSSAKQNVLKNSFSPMPYLISKVKHANTLFKFFCSALTVFINCKSTFRFALFFLLLLYLVSMNVFLFQSSLWAAI